MEQSCRSRHDHQHRRPDFAHKQIRAKLVLHQEPHRHKPIVLRADVDCRGKRSLSSQTLMLPRISTALLRCSAMITALSVSHFSALSESCAA
jgi:hypothetical protein